MSLRTLRFALAVTAVTGAVSATTGAAAAAAGLPAPIAGGTSAANIQLNSASTWVLMRWVARSTGTLSALHLRIQADGSTCRQDGSTGYGLGNGGSWYVTTHPVLADGRPDMSRTLATQDLRPCSEPTSVVDVRQGIVRLKMGIDVTRGHEYATVIRNTDSDPDHNFTSPNFLYTETGILGANGRNERSPDAPDAYYGLDPRELIGYSADGGDTWALPGGQYGLPGGRNFLPTYIQEYASGLMTGQPYYYTTAPSTRETMVFTNIKRSWTITALGAYTAKGGSGTLTLTVNGSVRARARVAGPGMVRATIKSVTVQPGQTVKVTSSGLSIQNVVADDAWGYLMGMNLPSAPWHLDGDPEFSHAAPVYALPAYGSDATAPVASAGHRTTPAIQPSRPKHHRKHHRHHRHRHHRHHRHRHHSKTFGVPETTGLAAPFPR